MKTDQEHLWRAFQDGCEIMLAGSKRIVTMRSDDAGSLMLPSGRIVVADPVFDPCCRPLTTSVTPGTYPVHLALGNGDVALLMVLFNEGVPARWRKARPFTFSVDSAIGCLMDYKVARFLRRKAEAGKYDQCVHRFEDALGETGLWANMPVDPVPDANLVLFRTWGGDGTFPLYFGYDASDEQVCLVIDMLTSDAVGEPSES